MKRQTVIDTKPTILIQNEIHKDIYIVHEHELNILIYYIS